MFLPAFTERYICTVSTQVNKKLCSFTFVVFCFIVAAKILSPCFPIPLGTFNSPFFSISRMSCVKLTNPSLLAE